MAAGKKLTIVFFHPDLGIGGAERLIIDAAVGLQKRGHKVVIFTSRCDPHHCFDETRNGTLDVRVRGDSIIPTSILSRFSILCVILRQIHLILSTYLSSELLKLRADAFIVDQLSAGLPWLAYLYPEVKIIFYCHFPDLLLAQGRSSWLKRVYRVPFDFIEEWSMKFADSLVVNSGFTKNILEKEFPNLTKQKPAQIIYPCVDVKDKGFRDKKKVVNAWGNKKILLSINRFERKKNVALAVRSYAGLGKLGRTGVRLVLAGGYDNQVRENVDYHKELVSLAESLGLKTITTKTVVTALNVPEDVDVLFLLSVPNAMKEMLLSSAHLLLYTPANEHFGIVPLEAMLAAVPVLAANTGGPLETVVDGKTGWHCAPDDIEGWTRIIRNTVHKMSDKDIQKIGDCGKKRVEQEFSSKIMINRFEVILSAMHDEHSNRKSCQGFLFFFLIVVVVLLDFTYLLASQTKLSSLMLGNLPVQPFVLTSLSLVSWILYVTTG